MDLFYCNQPRTVHVVTPGVFPASGGLEASVLRIAHALTEPAQSRVVIYTLKQPPGDVLADPAHGDLEIVHLGADKPFLLEPVNFEESENLRIDYLLLSAAVRERIDAAPDAHHVLLSFYATNIGFIAQHVALALNLPHVAAIQGSDYSRDFRSWRHSAAVGFVIEHASLIVTNNREQERVLGAAFPAASGFRTIHNAMAEEFAGPTWTCPPVDSIRLVSDCTFSFKKGPHVLLRAVATLAEAGLPVKLMLAGGVEARQADYWPRLQSEYLERYPGVFEFPGWQSDAQLNARLLGAHAFVSASFGEGCSLGQMRALMLGVPMVITRCGATPEVADGANHVRFCAPGDLQGFSNELSKLVADLRTSSVAVDQQRVQQWRSHFSPQRERDDWRAALAGQPGKT